MPYACMFSIVVMVFSQIYTGSTGSSLQSESAQTPSASHCVPQPPFSQASATVDIHQYERFEGIKTSSTTTGRRSSSSQFAFFTITTIYTYYYYHLNCIARYLISETMTACLLVYTVCRHHMHFPPHTP